MAGTMTSEESSSPTILVVDDDPHVRALICDLLELENYTTRTAASGNEALDSITANRPDCVILES